MQLRAFSVHIFTALGGGVALLALFEAAGGRWAAMFGWLGLALLIDGLDGPLARRWEVGRILPDWSGDTLDLVVDFVTYVFVPAYAIASGGLLLSWTASVLGVAVVVSGALYFADKRMKTDDHHFRGFPALWNGAAFYLFLLAPPAPVASAAVVLLVVLTFVPFNVVHPLRTTRLRSLNLILIVAWAGLALATIGANFDVSFAVKAALCAIALYILFSDCVIRLMKWRAT